MKIMTIAFKKKIMGRLTCIWEAFVNSEQLAAKADSKGI